jgi:dihydroorotate dehydrogenase electron transfer subunit
MQGQQFTCMPPKNGNWHAGDLLSIRYPLGKGFSLPESTNRLLMISGTTNSLRLLPAARDVLEKGGEAALFAYNPPGQISAEIELLTRDQLAEAIAWADCIIGDSAIGNLAVWKSMAAGRDRSDKKRNIQVLVDTPMACAGSAECGVCAVKTRHGWKRACTDGPVFLLEELDI